MKRNNKRELIIDAIVFATILTIGISYMSLTWGHSVWLQIINWSMVSFLSVIPFIYIYRNQKHFENINFEDGILNAFKRSNIEDIEKETKRLKESMEQEVELPYPTAGLPEIKPELKIEGE